MRQAIWPLVAAAFAGAMLPLQGAINARLSRSLQTGIGTAFVSFTVGAITLAVVLAASSDPFPSFADLRSTPKGLFIGGALGAIYVTSVLLIIPRIGVANTLIAVVVGQVIVALALDHFGVLGLDVRPITATRVIGAAAVVLGLYLVQR